jgi:hypothetical protein
MWLMLTVVGTTLALADESVGAVAGQCSAQHPACAAKTSCVYRHPVKECLPTGGSGSFACMSDAAAFRAWVSSVDLILINIKGQWETFPGYIKKRIGSPAFNILFGSEADHVGVCAIDEDCDESMTCQCDGASYAGLGERKHLCERTPLKRPRLSHPLLQHAYRHEP